MMEGALPEHITRDVQNRVYQTIQDITGEERFWVVPPRPSGIRGDLETCTWFVRGLSQESAAVLIDMGVVSNPAVTMFLSPLTVRPELLVSLGGFVSNIGNQIEDMVRQAVGCPGVRAVLEQLAAANPIFDNVPLPIAADYALERLEIDVIVLAGGAIVANAYMQSPAADAEGWRYLRSMVAAIPFVSAYNAPAAVRVYRCAICSGNDHPMNTCRFPTLHGWQGPIPPPDPPSTCPPPPGSALVYRPRQSYAQPPGRGRLPKNKHRMAFGQPTGGPQYGGGGRGGGAAGDSGNGGNSGPRPY